MKIETIMSEKGKWFLIDKIKRIPEEKESMFENFMATYDIVQGNMYDTVIESLNLNVSLNRCLPYTSFYTCTSGKVKIAYDDDYYYILYKTLSDEKEYYKLNVERRCASGANLIVEKLRKNIDISIFSDFISQRGSYQSSSCIINTTNAQVDTNTLVKSNGIVQLNLVATLLQGTNRFIGILIADIPEDYFPIKEYNAITTVLTEDNVPITSYIEIDEWGHIGINPFSSDLEPNSIVSINIMYFSSN